MFSTKQWTVLGFHRFAMIQTCIYLETCKYSPQWG